MLKITLPSWLDTAQLAHIGWGGFLTFSFALFLPWWIAALIATGIAFAKEAAESIWGVWELPQPWGWPGAVEDFSFFGVGIGFSLLLLIRR